MATLVQNLVRVVEDDVAALLQQQRFLSDFNQTARANPRNECVHELFERQVERSPEAMALVARNTQFTYRELNSRANQLARFLRRFGVGPDSLVGICVDRSPDMIVGILGILKAGAAYVPLDPTCPGERLSVMLRDANAFVLLTQSHLVDTLPQHNGPRLSLDSDWDIVAKERNDNPPTRTTPDNLAYVIYTSGSTGAPTGVMIPHSGLVNYLSWCSEAYEVAKGCGALAHSSIAFDLAITSLFSPLMVGRTVFLVDDGIENLAAALLARDDYSFLKITPAHLRALAELMPADQVAGRVRALIVSGAALYMENLSLWRNHAPTTRLINEYGPTETVGACCMYEVRPSDPDLGPVPIGAPVANTQLYVLDERLRLLDRGVVGELYIAGDCVGLGYLNRREQTDKRFIPNPFSKNGHARLYKTGHLARFNSDGILEYVGRR
ncbi:MAG: amino acid adenylation domain-containing protein [Pyrinomonadaceae bacterium]